jgi:hypothetical protein
MPAVGRAGGSRGDPQIGGLPALVAAGLRVESMLRCSESRVTDPLWYGQPRSSPTSSRAWSSKKLIAAEDWREMERDWAHRSGDGHLFLDAVHGRNHRPPRLIRRAGSEWDGPRARRMSYNAPMEQLATFIVVGFRN